VESNDTDTTMLKFNESGVLINTTTNQPVYHDGRIVTAQTTGAMKSAGSCGNNPVVAVETADGASSRARMEKPGSNQGRKTFSVGFLNTHATNTYQYVIFDGLGFISDDLNIPTLNGVVVTSGTRGANTPTDLRSLAQMSAIDIHMLHIRGLSVVPGSGSTPANAGTGTPLSAYTVVNSASILDGDNFQWAKKPDISTNTVTETFGLSIDTDGDTFDPTVRKFECRFQGQPWTGIVLTLPPLTGFSMNIKYSALAITQTMDLVK